MARDLFQEFFGRERHPDDYGIVATRVSTDERTQKSGADQVKLGTKALAKLGLPVEGVFEDNVSRSIWPRPGVERMLEALIDPHCVAVVSWYADRLFGDQRQQYEIFEALAENNVLLFDSELRVKNSDDEIAEVMAGIEALLSNFEVRKLRKRVYAIAKERFEEHGTWVQRPVFGLRFNSDTDRIERDEDRLCALRQMFQWIADDGMGTYAVAVKLQTLGVRTTPTRKDPDGQEFWNVATVRRIIHNEVYLGKLVWNRTKTVRRGGKKKVVQRPESEWIERSSPFGNLLAEPHEQSGRHDAEKCKKCLDAVDLFERAANVLSKRNRAQGTATGRHNRKYEPRLLDHVVRCARCGRKMYARHDAHARAAGHTRVEYRCATRRSSAGACLKSHVIPEKRLLAYLKQWLTSRTLDERVTVTLTRADAPIDERDMLKRTIAEIDDELDEYTRQLGKKRLTEARFDRLVAECESRLATARAQLDAMSPVAEERKRRKMTENVRATIAAALPTLLDERVSVERRQALLARHIEWINVDHPGIEIIAKLPD